jgi:hypothetical protein
MTESSFEYRQKRVEPGVTCADRLDLMRYLKQVSMDSHSLRHGLAEAVVQAFAGIALPDGLGRELPYPADRVEGLLFDDLMGADGLVGDPTLATALRQAMRLLEEATEAARLARVLLERADNAPPNRSTSQSLTLYARLTP